jgi:regulator of sigma E protease
VAKAVGIRVEEYSLGFGPSLWQRRWGETLYAARVIPLGGYVRMAGMEAPEAFRDDPRAFPNRPLWQRFAVILAGPFMNLVLAAVLYAVLMGPVGIPQPTTVVGALLPNYPAYAAGIRPGDQVVAVDGEPVHTWQQLDGAIARRADHPLTITVVRNGKRRTFRLQARYNPATRSRIVGIQPRYRRRHLPPAQALVGGIRQTAALSGAWFVALFRLVTGQGAFDVAGPVGIAVMVGQAARAGDVQLMMLAAALSANLGLFNLLPVPVLDGSRLFLLGVEGIRHRALNPEKENLIHMLGFAVLLAFVLFVTYHDVLRLLRPVG